MNYIGSKYSLLDFLENTISEVTNLKDNKGYVFADLFAGTGEKVIALFQTISSITVMY